MIAYVLLCVFWTRGSAGILRSNESEQLGVGLKVLLPGLGLETVVTTDFDPRP